MLSSKRATFVRRGLISLCLVLILCWGGTKAYFRLDLRPSPPDSTRAFFESTFCRGEQDVLLVYIAGPWDVIGNRILKPRIEKHLDMGTLKDVSVRYRDVKDQRTVMEQELLPMEVRGGFPAVLLRQEGKWMGLPKISGISNDQIDTSLRQILAP